MEKPCGELVIYDPRRLTGVSVYREVEWKFSVGERVRFTAPDKSLDVANRDLARIESISPDGLISAHLDNHRQIEFNAAEHRHFDHGYAVTSHSAQGLTAERVLIHADTSVHPGLLNSRFGYVSISRASHEATLFTDDAGKLGPRLSADISKSSAIEIQPGSIYRSRNWNGVVRHIPMHGNPFCATVFPLFRQPIAGQNLIGDYLFRDRRAVSKSFGQDGL